MNLQEEVKRNLRDIPDFPKPGILFKDITPLLSNAPVRDRVVEDIVGYFSSFKPGAIAAVEARGFIFGALLAQRLHVPFIPIRKAGKLPYQTLRASYELEYGTAEIEMHIDAVKKDTKVLLHDDVLATGGTAAAAGRLVQQAGGRLCGFSFVIDLSFLGGQSRIQKEFEVPVHSVAAF